MVRSTRCDKEGMKKGPWTPEEDQKLLVYIEEHGHGSWQALPAKAGLQRCGKSCRLRWTNYLRPDIKRGKFSLQEEQTIIQLHALLGNKWSAIATHLPKRTDNEIKNYWNTHLKKRLDKMGIDPVTHKPKANVLGAGTSYSKNAANLSHMAQWESARLEAEARLVRESKLALKPQQNQFGFCTTNEPLTAKAAALRVKPKCLDILKSWHGMVCSNFFVSGDSLESPTSTLNFPDNALAIPVAGSIPPVLFTRSEGVYHDEVTNSENELNCMEQGKENLDGLIQVQELMSTYGCNDHNNAWVLDPFRAANENASIGNSMEALSADIMVAEENTKNFEDNWNYWNSLLSLVDAPASGSSLF